MEQERIIKAILTELERQAQLSSPFTPWVGDFDGQHVNVDGYIDMPALAKVIAELHPIRV